jgi:hypothetical protein
LPQGDIIQRFHFIFLSSLRMNEFILEDPLPSFNFMEDDISLEKVKEPFEAIEYHETKVHLYVKKEWLKPVIVPPTFAGKPITVKIDFYGQVEALSSLD